MMGAGCQGAYGGVPRVGLPAWTWLRELNTGYAGSCRDRAPGKCDTTFVGPTGVAASWNRSLWFAKGSVIATEVRAAEKLTLSGFGPNINILKDPRYGRNSELPGEDPFLSGTYATHVTRGMQQTAVGTNGRTYQKILSLLKHYAVYNVESARFTWGTSVSMFDLFDSCLPAFQMAMTEVRQREFVPQSHQGCPSAQQRVTCVCICRT